MFTVKFGDEGQMIVGNSYTTHIINCNYINKMEHIRLEAFMVTELDKIFSGNRPCQLWIKAQHFRDHLRLHHQGNDPLIPLMMETEMVSEILGFYPQLTQLVSREDFIEDGT
jgi:hypothetical protein